MSEIHMIVQMKYRSHRHCGRVVKITSVSSVGSSQERGTHETGQVLHAGVPTCQMGFLRVSSVFVLVLVCLISASNNFERDVNPPPRF